MAKICPTCGSANRDASKFCTTCGARLPEAPGPDTDEQPAAPAAIPPGARIAPADQPPGDATAVLPRSSVGAADGHTRARSRFAVPLLALIAIVAVGVGALAAWAYSRGHLTSTVTHLATSTPRASAATPRTTGTPRGTPGGTPAATPATKPTAAPTAIALPHARAYSTGTFSVQVPASWKERTLATSILADNPGRRVELIVEATSVPAPTTPIAQLNQLETTIAKRSPDVQPCSRERQSTIDGVSGLDVLLCYTDKTLTGPDRQRTEETWYGTNAQGTVVYHYGLISSHADYGTMAAQARPSVSSIRWTLK